MSRPDPSSLVRIDTTLDTGSERGHGFIIFQDSQSGTYILTCGHVVHGKSGRRPARKIEIDGKYLAESTPIFEPPVDSDIDLAVIRSQDQGLLDRPCLPLGRLLEAKEYRILTYRQLTSSEDQDPEPFLTPHEIMAESFRGAVTLHLRNHNNILIRGGHSGSPVIDPESDLAVGIVTKVGSFRLSGDDKRDAAISVTSFRPLEDWAGKPSGFRLDPRVPSPIHARGRSAGLVTPVRILIAVSKGLDNELAIVRETVNRTNHSPIGRETPVQLYAWGDPLRRLGEADQTGEFTQELHGGDFQAVILLFGSDLDGDSANADLRKLERETRLDKQRLIYRLIGARDGSAGITSEGEPDYFRRLVSKQVPYRRCDYVEFARQFWNDYQDFLPKAIDISLDQGRRPPTAYAPPTAAEDVTNPYLGLQSYGRNDWWLFHGRSNEVTALRQRLASRRNGLLAVIGPSGCGKSSLVRAGLFHRLQLGAIAGSENWIEVETRLSTSMEAERLLDPVDTIARALWMETPAGDLYGQPADIVAAWHRPGGLEEVVASALAERPPGAKLVLYIDQFEEIFTGEYSGDQRYGFLSFVGDLAGCARVYLIITMRSDFYDLLMESPLSRLNEVKDPLWLKPADSRCLIDAIYLPASLAGYEFEDSGLALQILKDAGSGPGALPLLSYALTRLVEESGGRKLKWAAYEELNGVQGVIQKTADEVVEELNPTLKTKAALFRRLVTVNESGVPTKKAARFDPDADSTWTKAEIALKDQLVAKRLLFVDKAASTSDRKAADPASSAAGPVTIEIAHEALLTHWPALKKWVDWAQDALILKQKVESAALDWQSERKKIEKVRRLSAIDRERRRLQVNREHFWPQERLDEVLEKMKLRGQSERDFSDLARAFIVPESDRLLEELDHSATEQERRAEIGERLAALKSGDSRPGVGLRNRLPDIVWCAVPGGRVRLFESARADRVLGEFDVKPFHCAKYPVTIRQFGTFIHNSDVYLNDEWWTGLSVEPKEREAYPQRPETSNHPAKFVSWYQAVAFCRWLSSEFGYQVRLPTEWEWVQAATGGKSENVYPWGPEWDAERASHSDQGGLYRLMSVGMFPHGRSPVGALDMSGNMFEWCLNEFDDPAVVDLAGRNPRTSRGGAFFSPREHLTVRHRLRDNPNGYRDDGKTRIAVCIRLVADDPDPHKASRRRES